MSMNPPFFNKFLCCKRKIQYWKFWNDDYAQKNYAISLDRVLGRKYYIREDFTLEILKLYTNKFITMELYFYL